MVVSIAIVIVLMIVTMSYTNTVMVDTNSTDDTMDSINAEMIAQAGLNFALAELAVKNSMGHADPTKLNFAGAPAGRLSDPMVGPGVIGTQANPARFGGGEYYTTVSNPTVVNLPGSYPLELRTITCIAKSGTSFSATASRGYAGGGTRKLVAYAKNSVGGPFYYAIFAGNRDKPTNLSNDRSSLNFAGTGTKADNIVGGVYSQRDIRFTQEGKSRDAVAGDVNYDPSSPVDAEAKYGRTFNTRAGADGVLETGDDLNGLKSGSPAKYVGLPVGVDPVKGEEPIPDLDAMNYATKAAQAFGTNGLNGDPTLAETYVDVKKHMDLYGTSGSWSQGNGGTARQISDPMNPAHIFRKNPNNRTALNNSTPGVDDYFLEDPTVTSSSLLGGSNSNVFTGWNQYHYNSSGNKVIDSANGTNAFHVNLTSNADPKKDGNNKVYYIDGNLHVNNPTAYSFVMKHSDPNVRITFVVRGNIYIGDNVFHQDTKTSGMAFIAMSRDREDLNNNEKLDPGEDLNGNGTLDDNGGNIVLGDPVAGTMERIDAFLYASNDFVDNNLTSSGSSQFGIYGNMTAGDEVKINRGSGSSRNRMDIYFDGRVRYDNMFKSSMPGLPDSTSLSVVPFTILYKKYAPYKGVDVE